MGAKKKEKHQCAPWGVPRKPILRLPISTQAVRRASETQIATCHVFFFFFCLLLLFF
ncbi:hypothetical protein V8C43DRAFT_284069 [Trichoderma afarasin]